MSDEQKDTVVLDDSNYPAGSVELSNPKHIWQVLTELKGLDLAIVATLINAVIFKDTPYMGYLSLVVILALGLVTRLTGKKDGETSEQDHQEKDAPRLN